MGGPVRNVQREHDTLVAENERLREALEVAERERAALQQALDIPLVAMTQMRRDGTIVRINEAGARNMGGTPGEFVGKSIYALFPSLAEQTRARIEHALDTARPVPVEGTVRLPGGERCFRSTYYPIAVEAGEAETVTLVAQDITELKRLERLLEATEGRLAGILEYAPQLVVVLDTDGVIRYINRTLRFSSVDELVGTAALSYLPDAYAEPFRQSIRHVLETREAHLVEIDDLFGRHWEVQLAPIFRHGEVHQILAFAADISERREREERERQLEAQVQHAQKLESLGVLAGGIAHDFNNLLVGILGNAELALGATDSPPVRDFMVSIIEASQRAAGLCRQMLAFAGRGKIELDAVDVSQVASGILKLVRASFSKRVQIQSDCPAGLPWIRGDAAQLGQVLMNLLTNASDALGDEGGRVTLRSGVMQCDEAYLQRSYLDEKVEPGTYVYVEVQDTGCGMDAATQSRMFDPFFTSKQLGSGLGLAAALGIVRRHHGAIVVESEPGGGTTVRVLLPAVQGLRPNPEEPPEIGDTRHGTVLVVDDEPLVCAVARQALERGGHRVLVASNGEEAIEIYDADPGAIDFVLLDLNMPGMDGETTLRHLRARDPDLPVVLASGFSADVPLSARSGDRTTWFIAKPFNLRELQAAVQSAISELRGRTQPKPPECPGSA